MLVDRFSSPGITRDNSHGHNISSPISVVHQAPMLNSPHSRNVSSSVSQLSTTPSSFSALSPIAEMEGRSASSNNNNNNNRTSRAELLSPLSHGSTTLSRELLPALPSR